MSKLGRNDPCPCGSGKKYKKCHGSSVNKHGTDQRLSADGVKFAMQRLEALSAQQKKQQGMGRPIISCEHNKMRFVAVGNQIMYSGRWKTFHDFLFEYLFRVLGQEWVKTQQKLSPERRHKIIKWHESIQRYQKLLTKNDRGIYDAPVTGAASAFLNLSYNLYLLAHNAELQAKLVGRLKNPEQFLGAYYETYVAARFMLAGFTIDLEDEDDKKTSHCEFIAVHKGTCRKFSVEAKAREPGKQHAKVRSQLKKALKKRAAHDRVVFIDLNIPEIFPDLKSSTYMKEALDDLRNAEADLMIDDIPAPSAYVVLTNHPFEYLNDSVCNMAAVAEGFKIPDFKHDSKFFGIRPALDSRDRHREMLDLMDSMKEHNSIPSTFDGEIPEFMFGECANRLLVGNKYVVPDEKGNMPSESCSMHL